ncbi:septal ring lytic transglycosylase RlpA family protein [Methyloterricola oryzae]|uniref:septal ring lytic transglycosylase RlpA family protein n=1 Tax=Methyloterricola oryzae TaxID=1495050 RepID=UPI0009E656EA|nr:septal ring lytic transglycosylase RlpA family protein [Methyloterricola oryzae]
MVRAFLTPAVMASVGFSSPSNAVHLTACGEASYYEGRTTASGVLAGAGRAAHRSLPFGTRLNVTDLDTGRSTIVTVADRGPFVGGRIIDLNPRDFAALRQLRHGIARVCVAVVSGAS